MSEPCPILNLLVTHVIHQPPLTSRAWIIETGWKHSGEDHCLYLWFWDRDGLLKLKGCGPGGAFLKEAPTIYTDLLVKPYTKPNNVRTYTLNLTKTEAVRLALGSVPPRLLSLVRNLLTSAQK